MGELGSMPSSEFSDWLEFAQEEPFGAPWENWLMAVPAHMFASANTSKKKAPPKMEKFFFAGPRRRAQMKKKRVGGFLSMLTGKANKK